MTKTEAAQTVGTPPVGRANGTERWATITSDDGVLTVTAYRGWGITDEVTLSGSTARTMARMVADTLLAEVV